MSPFVRSNWFSGRGADSRTLREKLSLLLPRGLRCEGGKDEPIDSFRDVMSLENTMHNRDILARNPVDGDVARLVAFVRRVDEEEEVTAIERWFHRAAELCMHETRMRRAHRSENNLMGERKVHAPEHDDNGRLCICDKPEAFPYHETRGEDRSKIEDLEEDLLAKWGRFIRTPDAEGDTHMTKAKPSEGFDLF